MANKIIRPKEYQSDSGCKRSVYYYTNSTISGAAYFGVKDKLFLLCVSGFIEFCSLWVD